MKLYGALASPYVARVVLLARAKALDLVPAMPAGGIKSPAYLALNPFGKMPTLDHDGQALIESQVICEYLEDLHPAPALMPADPLGRARVRTLCRVLDLYVAPESGVLFRQINPATRRRWRRPGASSPARCRSSTRWSDRRPTRARPA